MFNAEAYILWRRKVVEVMGLTIRKQVDAMRRDWPCFRTIHRSRWVARWEGQVQPLCQPYTVQIELHRQHRKDDRHRTPPLVTIINPLLRRRSENPDEPIPHHYPNRNCPERPFLCLHYPVTGEWNPKRRISMTIVPWTIDWLACYEGWLATGEWTGGGIHPDEAT